MSKTYNGANSLNNDLPESFLLLVNGYVTISFKLRLFMRQDMFLNLEQF